MLQSRDRSGSRVFSASRHHARASRPGESSRRFRARTSTAAATTRAASSWRAAASTAVSSSTSTRTPATGYVTWSCVRRSIVDTLAHRPHRLGHQRDVGLSAWNNERWIKGDDRIVTTSIDKTIRVPSCLKCNRGLEADDGRVRDAHQNRHHDSQRLSVQRGRPRHLCGCRLAEPSSPSRRPAVARGAAAGAQEPDHGCRGVQAVHRHRRLGGGFARGVRWKGEIIVINNSTYDCVNRLSRPQYQVQSLKMHKTVDGRRSEGLAMR